MLVYPIRCGDWFAHVAPELGGNVARLQYKGEDVFVPILDEEQMQNDPYLHGAPILLPANRTRGAKFTFEGKEYHLPVNEARNGANLHGDVHRRNFTVEEYREDAITLAFENKGEGYPFPFVLTVEYAVRDAAFVQTYRIRNTGEGNLPLTFALHTSFIEPDSFTVPIDLCQEKDDLHLPTGRYVPLSKREARYAAGSGSKGIEISGYYRACGNVARVGKFAYTVSEDFDHWILFNGRGTLGTLCVEPQLGAVDGLNTGACRVLSPGEELTLWTRLDERD